MTTTKLTSAITLLCLLATVLLLGLTVHENREINSELQQYQNRFQERAGWVNTQNFAGRLHIITIDGGKNWVIITQGREVVQPPYLHQEFPNVNPDSLQILY